jgi:hypothetical protein
MRRIRLMPLSVGAALIITGVVWILQGEGFIKGSFMTGQAFWEWMGAAAVVVGVPVLLRGLRGS